MKRFMSGLACLALVAMSSVSAMAGAWVSNNGAGTIAGSFDAFTPSTGDLSGPLSFTTFFYAPGGANRTGAFAGLTETNSELWTGSWNVDPNGSTINDPYTFSDASFGTFTGKIVSEVVNDLAGPSTVGSRQINFVGTFTPGNNTHYEGVTTTLSNVTLQIIFSRNAAVSPAEGAINASWSMNTTAASPVPEPTSIAIFSLGAAGLAVRRFRRK